MAILHFPGLVLLLSPGGPRRGPWGVSNFVAMTMGWAVTTPQGEAPVLISSTAIVPESIRLAFGFEYGARSETRLRHDGANFSLRPPGGHCLTPSGADPARGFRGVRPPARSATDSIIPGQVDNDSDSRLPRFRP